MLADNFDETGIIEEPVDAIEVTEDDVDLSARARDPNFMPPHLKEGIPPVTCNFGKSDYWDGRYSKDRDANANFEWYHDYPEIQAIINQYCARDGRTLMLGCGNSTLSEQMYYDGYENIENVDFSRVAIDQMEEKYKGIKELKWKQMDVSDTPFEDAEFDCAVDKGTLDCVFCGDLALKKVRKYVHEMDRIIKHGGSWVIFSHGLPEDRISHFECDDVTSVEFLSFEVTVHAVAKPLLDPFGVPDLKDPDELYFVYVCTKNPVKSKQKDDRKNRILVQKEGKKALAKKLKELRQKQQQFGHLAKTPTRDEFGNLRTSDRVVHTEEMKVNEDLTSENAVITTEGQAIEVGESPTKAAAPADNVIAEGEGGGGE